MITVDKDLFDCSGGKDLNQIREEWKDCSKCPAIAKKRRGSKWSTVVGEGNVAADVLVVTEWLETEDMRAGRPLMSKNGVCIWNWVTNWAIDRADIFWTSVIGCRIVGQDHKYLMKIDKACLSACKPRIDDLIELVDPKLILLIGLSPALSLLGRTKIGSVTQYIKQDHSYKGRNVLVVPDPTEVSIIEKQLASKRKDVEELASELTECFMGVRKLYRELKGLPE